MPQDLKTILEKSTYTDDAQIVKQVTEQLQKVKSRMAKVKRKIAILSGKGGVGKSMTTANLALAFARQRGRVGILDLDLNGPCIPRMLGVAGQFEFTPNGALPPIGPYDMKIASIDFLLKECSPTRWKGPMEISPIWLGTQEMSVIREFLADVIWGEIDYLLIDMPPGAAADKPSVMMSFLPELDGAIVVTTASEVALRVVERSIYHARDIGIPILGLIENMNWTKCPECHTRVSLYAGESESICRRTNIPLLGSIPFDRQMSEGLDRGKIVPADHPIAKQFDQIALEIKGRLA